MEVSWSLRPFTPVFPIRRPRILVSSFDEFLWKWITSVTALLDAGVSHSLHVLDELFVLRKTFDAVLFGNQEGNRLEEFVSAVVDDHFSLDVFTVVEVIQARDDDLLHGWECGGVSS